MKWEDFPSTQNPNVPSCFQWMKKAVKYNDFLLGFANLLLPHCNFALFCKKRKEKKKKREEKRKWKRNREKKSKNRCQMYSL